MPQEADHHKQYQQNKNFSSQIESLNCYNDWQITALFYCALHKLEEFLSRRNQHFDKHSTRNSFLAKIERKYRHGATAYIDLYTLSIAARYKCSEITLAQITLAKDDLRDVEEVFK